MCHKGTHRKVNVGAEFTLMSVPKLSFICRGDHMGAHGELEGHSNFNNTMGVARSHRMRVVLVPR